MASKEDDNCFDVFSDDEGDPTSIDDEIVDGETTRSRTDSGAGPSLTVVTARISSDDKMKQLNKSEKKHLVDAIRQTEVEPKK